jgi:hypothetical protein
MAARSLRLAIPAAQVATLCVAYARQLREELADWDGRALTRFDSWS